MRASATLTPLAFGKSPLPQGGRGLAPDLHALVGRQVQLLSRLHAEGRVPGVDVAHRLRAELLGGPVLRGWRGLLVFLSRWFQNQRSLYKFNAKFQPEWVPRFLVFRNSRDLPRIGFAAMQAEGFVTLSLPLPDALPAFPAGPGQAGRAHRALLRQQLGAGAGGQERRLGPDRATRSRRNRRIPTQGSGGFGCSGWRGRFPGDAPDRPLRLRAVGVAGRRVAARLAPPGRKRWRRRAAAATGSRVSACMTAKPIRGRSRSWGTPGTAAPTRAGTRVELIHLFDMEPAGQENQQSAPAAQHRPPLYSARRRCATSTPGTRPSACSGTEAVPGARQAREGTGAKPPPLAGEGDSPKASGVG